MAENAPEIAFDTAPETALEAAHETAPDTAPDIAPEIAPDIVPEIIVTPAEDTSKVDKDESKPFNENDEEHFLEVFLPVPYMFILKDANGKEVSLPPDRLRNARVECPKFHVLLDHLVAVLWCFYSKKGLDLLESNQLHWALKILEGTRNQFGLYTDDVQMAIDHLTDAYLDVCAHWDIGKLNQRTYPGKPDYHTFRTGENTDVGGYESFKADIGNYSGLMNSSLHLADMICDADLSVFEELSPDEHRRMDTEGNDTACVNQFSTALESLKTEEKVVLQEKKSDIISLRNDKFREAFNILEEIKQLDEKLQDLPLKQNELLRKALEDLLAKAMSAANVSAENTKELADDTKAESE